MAESIHSPNFSSPNAHNSEIRQTFLLYGILMPLTGFAIVDMFHKDSQETPVNCSAQHLCF